MELAATLSGPTGTQPIFLDRFSFVYYSGNYLHFVSLFDGQVRNEEHFLVPGCDKGISAIATNKKNQWLAVAIKGLTPKIIVMEWLSKNVLGVLQARAAKGEFSAIDISRDGVYLAALSSELSRPVELFDMENLTLLDVAPINLPRNCNKLTFSPLDHKLFCAYGEESMIFCQLEQRHNTTVLTSTVCATGYDEDEEHDLSLAESAILHHDNATGTGSNAKLGPTCLSWLPDGSCVSGKQDGLMYLHDPESGAILSRFKVSSTELQLDTAQMSVVNDYPTGILLSTKHYIISRRDGSVVWLKASSKEEETTLSVCQTRATVGDYITTIVPTIDHNNFLALSFYGCVYVGDSLIHTAEESASNDELKAGTDAKQQEEVASQPSESPEHTVQAPEHIAPLTKICTNQAIPVLSASNCITYKVADDQVSLAMVVNELGELNVWDVRSKRHHCTVRLHEMLNQQTSETFHLVSHHPTQNLFALTTTNGLVILGEVVAQHMVPSNDELSYDVAHEYTHVLGLQPKTLYQAHTGPIASVVFSSNQPYLATCANDTLCVANIRDPKQPRLLGYCNASKFQANTEWTKLVWCEGSTLVAATREPHQVMSIYLVETSTDEPIDTSLPQNELLQDPVLIASATAEISSITAVNNTIVATLPKAREIMYVCVTDPTTHGSVKTSFRPLSCCAASKKSQVLVGTLNGHIQTWTVDSETSKPVFEFQLSLAQSAVTLLSWNSLETKALYSTASGATGILKNSDEVDENSSSTLEVQMNKVQDTIPWDSQDSSTLLQVYLDDLNQRQQIYYSRARDARAAQISVIKDKLELLVARNKVVDEMERLDRHEFIVNKKNQREIATRAEQRAEETEQRIKIQNEEKSNVVDRLKKECWESLDVNGKTLFGFGDNVLVNNFSIPKESVADARKIENVIQMRRVEVHTARSMGQTESPFQEHIRAGFPSDTDWIVNTGTLLPDVSRIFEMNNKNKEDGVKKGDQDNNDKETKNDSDLNEDELDESQDQKEDDKSDTFESAFKAPVTRLLYHPCMIRTSMQKRTQILLVRRICTDMRVEFNKHFEDMVQLKDDDLDRIASKNARIAEILEELKEDEEGYIFKATHDPREAPDLIMETKDEEVDVERYISRAERVKLEAEAEAKRLRELENAKDDTGQRALNDMMNGTLEVKKDSTTTVTLVRPEWMNEIEYNVMTPEQQAEFDEFVVKEQALQAEADKQRKLLEQEIKRIQGEIAEVASGFDERVEALANARLKVSQQIKVQELYMLRLSRSLLENEDNIAELNRLHAELATSLQQKATAFEELRIFRGQCDAHSEELRILQEEDRSLERGFKAAINEQCTEVLDLDTIKVLTQLFKQRRGKNKPAFIDSRDVRGSFSLVRRSSINRRISRGNSLARSSIKSTTLRGSARLAHTARMLSRASLGRRRTSATLTSTVALDPFEFVRDETESEKEERERKEALEPLNIESDLPEGFLIEVPEWNRLQDLRYEKILSELAVAKETKRSIELAHQLHYLQQNFAEIETRIYETEIRISELQTLIKLRTTNPDIVVEMKQGQDEVLPGPVVTSYSDAALIHRSVIEKENEEISKLGNTKVAILEKMKEFRKSINFMEWEHRYMLRIAHDLEEHYTDLHMLRVTRSLQEFIKGGDTENRNREKVAMVEAKLEHMKRAHKTRVSKLSQTVDKIMLQVSKKTRENDKLDEQYRKLHGNVSMRESVQSARTSIQQDGPVAQKDHMMKAIVTSRKLNDLSKSQAEEIQFLRQELDRIRKRTYPCFSTGGSNLYFNPDDRESQS